MKAAGTTPVGCRRHGTWAGRRCRRRCRGGGGDGGGGGGGGGGDDDDSDDAGGLPSPWLAWSLYGVGTWNGGGGVSARSPSHRPLEYTVLLDFHMDPFHKQRFHLLAQYKISPL